MADSIEDKGFLTERLEEDRQRMAIQVSRLKKEYNLANRLRASVQKHPQPWIMGALLTGFLLSRLPARRKEVYLWSDPLQRKPPKEVCPTDQDKDDWSLTNKLWSLAKPLISTYIGRELYNRVKRPRQQAGQSKVTTSSKIKRRTASR
jgi:hypothetical protein